MLPMISVIVPIYNASSRMDCCICCLLEQTYPNLEFLLIDDGSTDDSWERIRAWAAKDARIRPFRKENGGVSSARNCGLEHLRGEYVTFADADDTFSCHLIEWLFDALRGAGTQLSVCRVLTQNASGPLPAEPVSPSPARVIRLADYDQWADYAHVTCYAALYHTALLRTIRFDPHISYAEDLLFFTQALLEAGSMAYLPDRLYHYIQWDDSALHGCYSPAQFTDVTVWDTVCQMTRAVSPRLYQSSRTRYAFACTRAFYYSFTSPADCTALRRDAIRRLRQNWRDVLRMPSACRKEQSKALLAMLSPHLGECLWRLTKNA